MKESYFERPGNANNKILNKCICNTSLYLLKDTANLTNVTLKVKFV